MFQENPDKIYQQVVESSDISHCPVQNKFLVIAKFLNSNSDKKFIKTNRDFVFLRRIFGDLYCDKLFNLYLSSINGNDKRFKEIIADFRDISFEDSRSLFTFLSFYKEYNQANILLDYCDISVNIDDAKCRNHHGVPTLIPKYDAIRLIINRDYNSNLNKIKLRKAYCNIMKLFSDLDNVKKYLSELDDMIASKFEYIGCFIGFEPELVVIDGLLWPKYNDSYNRGLRKNDFLADIIKSRLKHHGIGDDSDDLKFFGYVDRQVSKQVIANSSLFKEHFLSSTSLFHGVMSHYVQFYVLARAFEDNYGGEIEEKEGLAKSGFGVKELMQISVNASVDGMIMWNSMFDTVANYDSKKMINFRHPTDVNSYLLTNSDFKFLRNYSLHSFFKKLDKIYAITSTKDDINTSKEEYLNVILASQILSETNVDRVNLGIDVNDLAKYYRDKGKTVDFVLRRDDLDPYHTLGDRIKIVVKKLSISHVPDKYAVVVKDSNNLGLASNQESSISTSMATSK